MRMSILGVIGLMLTATVLTLALTGEVGAQDQVVPKESKCPEELAATKNVLRTQSVTESMLEAEVKQKRSQVASLGLQLQEERQAHEATKKQLMAARKAVEKPAEK